MRLINKKPKKLHLACGPNIVSGWDNVDILDLPGIKKHDLRQPLPYKDNSAEKIFHEHFIEHLAKADGIKFLKECYRVLKPGGVMKMGWPDLAKLLDAYQKQKKDYRDYVLPHLENHLFGDDWDEILSDCLFNWEHRYAYTESHMRKVLENVGFKNIKQVKFRQSKYGIDIEIRDDLATTFLEAIK